MDINKSEDHIKLDNIDNLTEDELRILEKKFKAEQLPSYRLWMLLPFNIVVGGFAMYYTINFKKFSKQLFKPKTYGIKEIIKYGTLQSVIFLTVYIGGTFMVTGFWHPVQYLRTLAMIKGKQIDTALKFDPYAQEHFLFDTMKYFGLSETLVHKAKDELDSQKHELDAKNYFSEDTKKLINEPVDILEQQNLKKR